MLSLDARSSKKSYSFVSGMLNVAYLVGFARNIIKSGPTAGFLLQQTNNMNHALPITLAGNTKIPNDMSEGEPVKVIAHVYGRRLESGERTCIIEAIDFERPTLLEMPPSQAWNNFLPAGVPTDHFNPFNEGLAREVSDDELNEAGVGEVDRERIRLGRNANLVYLSGFVDAYMFGEKEGKIQRDCLIILLRQHAEQDRCVPLRHYGKYAAPYKKAFAEERKSVAQIGFPLLVEGQLRVRVKPLAESKEGEITPIERLLYVHMPHPLVATRKEILTAPSWVTELYDRALKGKQPGQEGAALSGEAMPAVTAAIPKAEVAENF